MNRVVIFLVVLIGGVTFAHAQNKLSREAYIDKYKSIAISNMKNHGVPASITMAQACLESANGNSELSVRSNNHFGIKCHSSWEGDRVYHDDDRAQECFRVYNSVEDSYADHSAFLQRPRYAACFELKIADYKGWAKALKDAGYATNPKYPKLLIKIIEDYRLYELDKAAMGKQKRNHDKGEKEAIPESNGPSIPNEISLFEHKTVSKTANGIRYITPDRSMGVDEVARSFEMGPWQIKGYNDVEPNHQFAAGERIYLQPKRRKGTEAYYVVQQDGEELRAISQQFGIKIWSLRWKNRLSKNPELKKGQKLYLQERAPK